MVCKVPSSEHEAYRIAPGMDIAAAFKEQLLYPKDWYVYAEGGRGHYVYSSTVYCSVY